MFERALALRSAAHFPQVVGLCQASLGAAYALAGRVREGLPLLERGLEPSLAPGIRGLASLFPVWLGEGYVLMDRLEEARQLGQQARTSPDPEGTGLRRRMPCGSSATWRPTARPRRSKRPQAPTARPLPWPRSWVCARSRPTATAAWGHCMPDQPARAGPPRLTTAIEMYRNMEMTFWLPETEAALAQVEGR